MNASITAPDPIRRKLWQIFDEIRRTNPANRRKLLEREKHIRRRWIREQARAAGGAK